MSLYRPSIIPINEDRLLPDMSIHQSASIPTSFEHAPVSSDVEEKVYATADTHKPEVESIQSISPKRPYSPVLSDRYDNEPPDVNSIVRYFCSIEKRVASLEAEVERLSSTVSPHGKNKPVPRSRGGSSVSGLKISRSSTSASAIPKILRLNQEEFEHPASDSEGIHAIELLVADDVIIRIRIRSEILLEIFQDVMGPDVAPNASKSAVMIRPFKALMTFSGPLKEKRASLKQIVEEIDSSSLKGLRESKEPMEAQATDAATYLDLLFEALSSDFKIYSALRSRSEDSVSFLHLWYLFQPGDIIIDGSGTSMQAYKIRSSFGGAAQISRPVIESDLEEVSGTFELVYFSVGYDGQKFGPVQGDFTIAYFSGSRNISSIPILPIEYLRNENIQQQLIVRGKLFNSLRKPSHKSYSGITLDQIPEQLDGEVIVDLDLYCRQNPDKTLIIGLSELRQRSAGALVVVPGLYYSDTINNSGIYDDSKIDNYLSQNFLKTHAECLEEIETKKDGGVLIIDSQLMLLPSLVWAFDLRGRKWHALDINMIRDIVYPMNAFDYLVLPAGHKDVLSRLVSHHIKMKGNSYEEILARKGMGLVMLLHGPPGVGKTSTVECLAAYAKKPLLPISAAGVGETAHDVERYLEKFFYLSHRWGCIILFDEADILLSARNRTDMQQNTIVSVFLRVLEYYSGILILTTNRVGTIDEAFKSRIHLSLYYPPPDKDACLKIWEMALHRARDTDIIEVKMASILRYLKSLKWGEWDHRLLNGREIVNAVRSATALAEQDEQGDKPNNKPIMTRHHISAILQMADRFDKYMTVLQGGTDDAQAMRSMIRNDDNWDKPKYVSRSAPRALNTTSRRSEKLVGSRIEASSVKPLEPDDESEEDSSVDSD